MSALAAVACVLGLALALFGEGTGRFAARAIGKVTASLAFLGWAAAWDLTAAGPHGVAMMIALVLSLIGDVLLLATSKRWFLLGIGAFLLAHVAYGVAFVLLGPALVGVLVSAVPLVALGAGVWRWLGPHTGRLRGAVVAYMVAITAMVALAGGVATLGSRGPALLVGAGLFFVSDLFVARQRFVHASSVNRYVGLPLYYAAQLLLAWAGATVTS